MRQGKSTPQGAELELGAVMYVTEHSIFSAQVAPEEGMGPPQMKMSAQIRRVGIGWPAECTTGERVFTSGGEKREEGHGGGLFVF